MKKILSILLIFTAANAFSQKAAVYTLCGKSGDCTMTWDEFLKCKKELITTDKKLTVNSFVLTITKEQKKDTTYVEYQCKGNAFSKQANEAIAELRKDKKLGDKVLIEAVQVVESGKEARKVAGMVIKLTN